MGGLSHPHYLHFSREATTLRCPGQHRDSEVKLASHLASP